MLLLKCGFEAWEGVHIGGGEKHVSDDVREGGSLYADVAVVEGRDDASLTMDDRFDAIVDTSEGKRMGDNEPGDG